MGSPGGSARGTAMKLKVSYIQLPADEAARRTDDVIDIVRSALLRSKTQELAEGVGNGLRLPLITDRQRDQEINKNQVSWKGGENHESYNY